MTAVPGETPRSPLMVVLGLGGVMTLVTVAPARTAKLFALPSVGAVCAHADWNDAADRRTAVAMMATSCGVCRGRVGATVRAFIFIPLDSDFVRKALQPHGHWNQSTLSRWVENALYNCAHICKAGTGQHIELELALTKSRSSVVNAHDVHDARDGTRGEVSVEVLQETEFLDVATGFAHRDSKHRPTSAAQPGSSQIAAADF